MKIRVAPVAVVLAALCCWSAYATPTLTLIPSNGSVSGFAGQTVGWGYSIMNDTSFFLLINNSYFCGPGGDPSFTDCTTNPFGPAFGVYTDYIAAFNPFTEVPPNTTIGSPPFSPGTPGTANGVGEYKINLGTPIGSMDNGTIFITFDEFNGNPFDGGQPVGSDQISAKASVTVVATPEPATFLLLGGALLALAGLRRAKRL
jgi:PEP-CTERM motif